MHWMIFALIGTSLTAVSCATPRGEVPEQRPLPEDLAETSAEEISLEEASKSEGTPLFGDGEGVGENSSPEDVKSATLRTVLDAARRESARVLRAEGERTVAAGQRREDAADFAPTLRAGLGFRHLSGREIGSFGDVRDGLSFSEFEPTASLQWRFSPWEQIASFRAGRLAEDAATLHVADQKRLAMASAAQLYFRVLLHRASHRIAGSLVEDAREFLSLAEARAAGGVESESDVARARAELAKAKQKRQRTLKQWRIASAKLATKIGWERADRPIAGPDDGALHTRTIVDTDKIEELASIATTSRSDLESARKRVNAAQKRESAALGGVFGIHAAASAGARAYGVDLANLGPTFLVDAFVGAHLDLAKLGAATAAQGHEEKQRAKLLRIEREIRRELAAARARLTSAERSLEEARNQLEAAERNHAIQKSRFEAGTALGLEVIRAQNMLAEARLDLAHRIASYNLAQIELLAAAGRLTHEAFDR